MPTNRTRIKPPSRPHVTPEAVKLWRTGCEILDAGADEAWEEDGGRQREWYDVCLGLDRAFGFRPWECVGIWFFNLRFEDCPDDRSRRKDWELVQALNRAAAVAGEPVGAK
jgi:hypothetical protein